MSRAPGPSGAEREPPGRFEGLIGTILRVGVLVSVTVVVIGVAVSSVRHPASLTSAYALDRLIAVHGNYPSSIPGVIRGIWRIEGAAVVSAGLLVLVLTPVLRVAASLVLFARERDWRFVVITAVVLGLLVLSFAVGRAGA
jgi:uncharacterized membrane protein